MNSPPTLRELQLWLQWVITDPRGVAPALANPRPPITEFHDRYLEPTASQLPWLTAPAVPRLNVYGEGYFFRILECLEKDFPRCRQAAGAEKFAEIVAGYLKAYPSTFATIDQVGCNLANFLAGDDSIPYLGDLARFEWNLIEVFFGPEAPPTNSDWQSQLGNENASELRFQMQPALRLMRTRWPLIKIVESLDSGAPYVDAGESAMPSFLQFFRHQDLVRWEGLPAAPFELLESLRSGLTLGEALANSQGLEEDEIAKHFSRWMECGIFFPLTDVARQNSKPGLFEATRDC